MCILSFFCHNFCDFKIITVTPQAYLNTKMNTKSQRVQGNVFFYLGPKYSKLKNNFKSYVHFKFFLP